MFVCYSEMDTDVPLGEPITGTVFIVKDEDGQIITNGNGYLFIGEDMLMLPI